MGPDCEECLYQPPVILKQNRLFVKIYSDCQYSRDFYGRVNLDVFIKLIDIYANILGLSDEDKLLLIRKMSFISSIEEKHKPKGNDNSNKAKRNSIKVIGRR